MIPLQRSPKFDYIDDDGNYFRQGRLVLESQSDLSIVPEEEEGIFDFEPQREEKEITIQIDNKISTLKVIAKNDEVKEKIKFFEGLGYEKITEYPYKINQIAIIFRRVINESFV
jgi:hypothetical protein